MAAQTPSEVFAIITIAGFGIQQFNQIIVDPVVTAWLNPDPPAVPRQGIAGHIDRIPVADKKKVILGVIALLIGLAIAGALGFRVLTFIQQNIGGKTAPNHDLDAFFTALVLSAGTEGANSVVKLAQYLKDATKKVAKP